jgi:hypothetical protein
MITIDAHAKPKSLINFHTYFLIPVAGHYDRFDDFVINFVNDFCLDS